jgi:thiazole synthase ThiGH ThiG subunit
MIEVTSIPSGKDAIDTIKKLMGNGGYADEELQRQLIKNTEEFIVAIRVLTEKVDETIENNLLNTLQNLEFWMRHNRTIRGTYQCYLALRVLNTHLSWLFCERYN